MVLNIVLIIAAYLLGSIPSAVWIGRCFYGVDVREHGSHNAGTTNVLRVLGRRAAAPVFMIDVLKGFVAVMLFHFSKYTIDSPLAFDLKIVLVAAVVTGHIFPIFAGFKGGKGVATLTGAVLGVYPPAIILCFATFCLLLLVTHYVSLSSITAGVLLPFYTVFVFKQTYWPLVLFTCIVATLIVFTHRKNIGRLIQGTESKIYLFKKRK